MPPARRSSQQKVRREGVGARLVNPLAVVFGRALARLRRSTSSADVARALDLKYSSYRLIETGVYPLNPARSMRLARKLELPDWSRLAGLLVTIQVIDDALESFRTLKLTIEELQRIVEPDLGALLRIPASLWTTIEKGNLGDEDDGAQELDLVRLVELTERYLRGDVITASRPSETGPPRVWSRDLSGTPPYYLEILLRRVGELFAGFDGMMPPRVNEEALATFEAKNETRFRTIHGILKSPSTLDYVVEEQGAKFTWGYLLRSEFESFRVASCGVSPMAASRRLSKLQKNIKLGWERTRPELRPVEVERALAKIAVRPLDEGRPLARFFKYDAKHEKPAGDGCPSPVEIFNVWCYALAEPTNVVAFLDDFIPGERPPVFATSCSWQFTEGLVSELEEFWNGSGYSVEVVS